jgi:hypothetical protein
MEASASWPYHKPMGYIPTIENNDIVALLEIANIKIRYIDENTKLKNYKYIEQEINKGNPWSASDILRISILLQEPGYTCMLKN